MGRGAAPRRGSCRRAAARQAPPALKSLTLSNKAGDSATVYPFGACVTSYVKGGVDQLMVRPDAKMDGSKPISGGIPHCFPQFGPGAIQQHGFARNLDWEVLEQSDSAVTFGLSESEYTMGMWPYPSEAKYTLTLSDARRAAFRAAVLTYGCAPAEADRAAAEAVKTRRAERGGAAARPQQRARRVKRRIETKSGPPMTA